jgi:hypothetical protein
MIYETWVNRNQLAHYVAQFAEREKTNDLGVQQLVDFFKTLTPHKQTSKRQKVDANIQRAASPDDTSLSVNLNNLKQSQAVSCSLELHITEVAGTNQVL